MKSENLRTAVLSACAPSRPWPLFCTQLRQAIGDRTSCQRIRKGRKETAAANSKQRSRLLAKFRLDEVEGDDRLKSKWGASST